MPRLNLILLLSISVGSFVCYWQAERDHRTRYGRMLGTFSKVMSEIDDRYVEEVDNRKLFEAALRGVTDQLDPYSTFISADRYAQLMENLDQKFGGIGVQVMLDKQTKTLTVSSPLVGSPAFEAGMRAGDKILNIDGKSTKGFTLLDAVDLIKGDPGDSVRLTILHEGDEKPVEIVVERAIINVETVMGDRRNDDGSWNFLLEAAEQNDGPRIGYVRVNSFSENTVSELNKALDWLERRHAQGLILDLRFNPGGLLNAAVQVCDMFVAQGRIVSTRGRNGVEAKVFDAHRNGTRTGFPMAVIINHDSASASEIVAACLQDHRRATVVGERSYGKGSVQDVIQLEGGTSALKLTVASYWRPSGKNIHRFSNAKDTDVWGVMPDPGHVVKLEGDELEKALKYRQQRDVFRPGAHSEGELYLDPQVKDALNAVKRKLAAAPQRKPA